SKVSFWLGPPSIQSRMHDLCLTLASAACAASPSNQPDTEVRAAPAAVNRRKSRRDSAAVRELVMRGLRRTADGRLEISDLKSPICHLQSVNGSGQTHWCSATPRGYRCTPSSDWPSRPGGISAAARSRQRWAAGREWPG